MDLAEQLLDAWRINCRINHELLAELSDDQYVAQLAKGKPVAAQFAHMHNVRRMWLRAIDEPAGNVLVKLERGAYDRTGLDAALATSDTALANAIAVGLEAGKVRNFKPSPAAFVCYLMAHEGNHRAQVELALRQADLPLTTDQEFGQWQWGKL